MAVNFKKIITIAGLENFKIRQDAHNAETFIGKNDVTINQNNQAEILLRQGEGNQNSEVITLLTPDSELTASKIRGVISLDNIPSAALETLYTVENEADRLNLTYDDVQNGDTVKVLETNKLYLVVNDNLLAEKEDGEVTRQADTSCFVEYAASIAGAVNWVNVLGKPSEFTPENHASSKVTSMTGYDLAYSGVEEDQETDPADAEIAIEESDSLNTAVAKLAYMLQFATIEDIGEAIFGDEPVVEPEPLDDPDNPDNPDNPDDLDPDPDENQQP